MAEGTRVLYVDDEPGLLELTKLFLEQSGEFHVETAESAKEVLASSQVSSYEAIVSDYQMPGMDGISFLKAVRSKHGNVPFILFTGRGREEVVIEAINNGADFYLQKGGEPKAQFAELEHKIRQAISRRQAQEALRVAYDHIAASEEELRGQYDELVRNEKEIRESETRFRELAELLPQIVFEMDCNLRITFVNHQAYIQLGFTSEEAAGGFDALSIIDPSQHALIRDKIGKIYRKEAYEHSEYTIHRRDGSTFPALIYANPVHKTGRLAGLRGIIIDISDRKRVENDLFESQQMLQTVLDTIPQRVFWKDTNLVFRGCNKPLANDVGYRDPSEMIGKTDYDHSSAAIAEHFRDDDRMVMETGIPKINFEEPQIRPDGSTAWLRTSKVPLRSRDGATVGVLGTYEDITDAKRAQIALQESEAKYRDLTDSLPQIVFETDLNLRVTYANRHALAVFGLTESALAEGIDILSFIDPSGHGEVRDSLQKLTSGIPFEPKEYTGLKKDGSRFSVLIYSSPVYRDKILAGFRGVVLDISARKKMEDGLRESEEKFRSFVENADDVIYSVTPEGVLTYISPRVMDLLGYSPDELSGQSFTALIHPDDLASSREFLHRDFVSGKMRNRIECRLRNRNGSWQVYGITASPVRNAPGIIVSIVGSIRDLTGSRIQAGPVTQSG